LCLEQREVSRGMVLEKGFLALSAGTRRPNEGDFGTGANEIKGRNDGDVEAGRRELRLWNGRHRHPLCKRNRFRLQPLACMINEVIASSLTVRNSEIGELEAARRALEQNKGISPRSPGSSRGLRVSMRARPRRNRRAAFLRMVLHPVVEPQRRLV